MLYVLTSAHGGSSLPFPVVACEVSISIQFVAMVAVVHCLGTVTISSQLNVSIFNVPYFRADDCCRMIILQMNVVTLHNQLMALKVFKLMGYHYVTFFFAFWALKLV